MDRNKIGNVFWRRRRNIFCTFFQKTKKKLTQSIGTLYAFIPCTALPLKSAKRQILSSNPQPATALSLKRWEMSWGSDPTTTPTPQPPLCSVVVPVLLTLQSPNYTSLGPTTLPLGYVSLLVPGLSSKSFSSLLLRLGPCACARGLCNCGQMSYCLDLARSLVYCWRQKSSYCK